MTASEPATPNLIERALLTLSCVAKKGAFNLKEVADEVGIPSSTAYRLLQAFAAADFVEKSGHGTYRIGRQFVRVASLIVDSQDYEAIVRPHLDRLSDLFHETCAMAVYLPTRHSYAIMASVPSIHPLKYVLEKFVPRPMVWGALGRSMLPFLSKDEVMAALENQGSPLDRNTPPMTYEELTQAFSTTRKEGCYVGTSADAYGASGTAAAILDPRGRVWGSIGVTTPVIRYDPAIQPEISAAVIEASRSLSLALAGTQHSGAATRQ